MDLGAGEHVLFSGHPSWRATLSFYLKGLVVVAVGVVIAILASGGGTAVGVGLALFAILVLVGFLVRIGTTYTITNQRLHIRRGIIARRTQEARLERVQNVNTEQGVLERILQVGTVDFDTAGTTDAEFAFRGVSQPERVVRVVGEAQREHADEERPSAL